MSSWKARLLMALTILTMLLTMSAAPAMANDWDWDHDRFRDHFLGFDRLDCWDCDDDFDHGDVLTILEPGECAVVWPHRLVCNNQRAGWDNW